MISVLFIQYNMLHHEWYRTDSYHIHRRDSFRLRMRMTVARSPQASAFWWIFKNWREWMLRISRIWFKTCCTLISSTQMRLTTTCMIDWRIVSSSMRGNYQVSCRSCSSRTSESRWKHQGPLQRKGIHLFHMLYHIIYMQWCHGHLSDVIYDICS